MLNFDWLKRWRRPQHTARRVPRFATSVQFCCSKIEQASWVWLGRPRSQLASRFVGSLASDPSGCLTSQFLRWLYARRFVAMLQRGSRSPSSTSIKRWSLLCSSPVRVFCSDLSFATATGGNDRKRDDANGVPNSSRLAGSLLAATRGAAVIPLARHIIKKDGSATAATATPNKLGSRLWTPRGKLRGRDDAVGRPQADRTAESSELAVLGATRTPTTYSPGEAERWPTPGSRTAD